MTAKEVQQRVRKYNRLLVNGYKNWPCMDCKKRFPPECMDFDHVRGEKLADIAKLSRHAVKAQRILDEIQKCDLVCANCHRIRTAKRRSVDRTT